MNERTNDDACVRPSVDGGGGRSHVPFPEPSSCLRSSFVRILRARATFISIIRFSAPSVENPSLGVRTSTSFHFISFHSRVGFVRNGNPPRTRARGGYRIVSRGFSVRCVPFSVVALCRARVIHPSIERERSSNVRSFPHDCPRVSPPRGVYIVLEQYTL